MPVSPFVDDPKPPSSTASIWRYVGYWKLKDLITTQELYFRRADLLNDEHEGLPPTEYERILNLNKYDLNDIKARDHDIGSLAQFRQWSYVNCWHLQDEETPAMWARFGKDGVAIRSRYDLLRSALEPLQDNVMLGPIRYGTAHLVGWNVLRFVTTKRESFASEREVRALIWRHDSGDGVNRHIDLNNWPHDRPILDPPPTLPEGLRRRVDLNTLIVEVIVSPFASASCVAEARQLLSTLGLKAEVRESSLTRYKSFLPTDDELKRFM